MMWKFRVFALASIAFSGLSTLLAQDSDQRPSAAVMQTVEAAFPQNLRYVGAPPSGLGALVNPYNSCAAVFNRSADGTPDLIAAAYSGHGVEVAMLTYQTSASQIIVALQNNWPLNTNKVHQFNFVGGPCDASIVNLADPAQEDSPMAKTVKISFGGQDWYFLWDGKNLRNITALMKGGIPELNIPPDPSTPPDSYMHTSGIVDVDHRGAMQIIGNNGDSDNFAQDDGITATGTELFFRYNGTSYELAKRLLLLGYCEPKPADWNVANAGPWTGKIEEIDMHRSPASSYTLLIVNCDREGSNRVTSATVEVNGVAIVMANEVNQSVENVTRAIQLQKENEIKLMVDGPEKSHVYVTVE